MRPTCMAQCLAEQKRQAGHQRNVQTEIVYLGQDGNPVNSDDDPVDTWNAYDIDEHVSDNRYEGLLIRYDLDARVFRAREMLIAMGGFGANSPAETLASVTENGSVEIKDISSVQKQLLFVCDTFNRLETARRAETQMLLEEHKKFNLSKRTFLNLRTQLLEGVTSRVQERCQNYGKDYDDLEKHRHYLDKEVSNIKPKLDKAERMNKSLKAMIDYVQNYGPMIAEKLLSEEAQLEMMRQEIAKTNSILEVLEKELERALISYDGFHSEIQRKRNDLADQIQKQLEFLRNLRCDRYERRKSMTPTFHEREFLYDKFYKLREKAEKLQIIVTELKNLAESNKSKTEFNLAKLKVEKESQESRRRADLHLDGPTLTKEQLKERMRQQKLRRERKAHEKMEKQQRQQQILERNFAKMRAQLRVANDHLSELLSEKKILEPQLERLNYLDDTFQSEYDQKMALKAELLALKEIKEEEIRDYQLKLDELRMEFKLKITAQHNELEKAKRNRKNQEQQLKEFKRKDKLERKQLAAELLKKQAKLKTCTDSLEAHLSQYESFAKRNRDNQEEINELELAAQIANELLLDAESKRQKMEVGLNDTTTEHQLHLQAMYDKICDIVELSIWFANEGQRLRIQFVYDISKLSRIVLISTQEQKMHYHIEYESYKMLMWHFRRLMALKVYFANRGEEMRSIEMTRTVKMRDYAQSMRRDLHEVTSANFRILRKYYHLNVVYHILHIENVRNYFRSSTADDSYRTLLELLAAEKVFKKKIKDELDLRRRYWIDVVRKASFKLVSQVKIVTDVRQEALNRTDMLWEDAKSKIVLHQNIGISQEIKDLLVDDFRSSGSLFRKELGACALSNKELLPMCAF